MSTSKGVMPVLIQFFSCKAKVACGNGEQVLSRDIYRLGHRFDFFRMLSCYFTTVGFYISSLKRHICTSWILSLSGWRPLRLGTEPIKVLHLAKYCLYVYPYCLFLCLVHSHQSFNVDLSNLYSLLALKTTLAS